MPLTAQESNALSFHLGHNLYPPVPFMWDAAAAAIEYKRTGVTPEGCPEGHVPAPLEITKGRPGGYVPADEVIANCRLEFFLEDADE